MDDKPAGNAFVIFNIHPEVMCQQSKVLTQGQETQHVFLRVVLCASLCFKLIVLSIYMNSDIIFPRIRGRVVMVFNPDRLVGARGFL